jgi:hypothetical protein
MKNLETMEKKKIGPKDQNSKHEFYHEPSNFYQTMESIFETFTNAKL